MKKFISENLNSMTFIFSFIVLLNILLNYFEVIQLEDESSFILGLALFILLLHTVPYILAFFTFTTKITFHLINLTTQLIAFFILGGLMGLIPLNVTSILVNIFTYIILYYLNVQIRNAQVSRLANKINSRLSNGT